MDSTNLQDLLQENTNLYRLQELVEQFVTGANGSRFVFSEAIVQRLHSVAMHRLLANAGNYRQCEVHITNSPHKCPSWIEVPGLMAACCHYVNDNWEKRDLVHLAAFVLWRINYIHPFENGNGRTSRAASYMVLCARQGGLLPGRDSIVTQITKSRDDYYKALRDTDTRFAQTANIDTSLKPLERLIEQLLLVQLRAAFGG